MKHVGSYEIQDVIGDGGTGTVYRARDPRFGRLVAVKVLHPRFARDPRVVERFRAEAVVQAKLEHPHVVPVYDFVVAEQALAIVMELVQGLPLDAVIRRAGGPPPVAWAVTVLGNALGAVRYAHEQGLVHGDLKPANILVREMDGEPFAKVTDFGIATLIDTTAGAIGSGAPGRLAYRPPEQLRSPRDADARTDVYALGATLYEVLSGAPPFAGDHEFALVSAIVSAPVRSLIEVNPAVSPSVAGVVERAMSRDPNARYQTCAAFAEALRQAAAEWVVPSSRRMTADLGLTDAMAPYVATESDSPLAWSPGANRATPEASTPRPVVTPPPVPRAGTPPAAPVTPNPLQSGPWSTPAPPPGPTTPPPNLPPPWQTPSPGAGPSSWSPPFAAPVSVDRTASDERAAAVRRLLASVPAAAWIVASAIVVALIVVVAFWPAPEPTVVTGTAGGAKGPTRSTETVQPPVATTGTTATGKRTPERATLPRIQPESASSRGVAETASATNPAAVSERIAGTLGRARRFQAESQYTEAYAAYQDVLQLDPRNQAAAQGRAALIDAYNAEVLAGTKPAGLLEGVPAPLRPATVVTPTSAADIAQAEGMLNRANPDYDGAIRIFKAVLAREPGNAKAAAGLARAQSAKAAEASLGIK